MDAKGAKDTLGRHLLANGWVLVDCLGRHWRAKHPEGVPRSFRARCGSGLPAGAVLRGLCVLCVPGGLLFPLGRSTRRADVAPPRSSACSAVNYRKPRSGTQELARTTMRDG